MRHRITRSVWYFIIVAFVVVGALALAFTSRQPARSQGEGLLPWVVYSAPVRGEELAITGTVSFTFNAPMDRNSVEDAFSVSPQAFGVFEWRDDTTVTFIPANPFDRATAYIFTIASSARSGEGVNLRDVYSLKLYTMGYLAVTQFLPEDEGYSIPLEQVITLVFNRPVVPLGTAEQMQKFPAPFVSDPPIEGSGEWLTTTIYNYKPKALLKSDTVYVITVPATLTDITGSSPREDITFKFKTIRVEEPKPAKFDIHHVSPIDKRTGIFLRPRIVVGFTDEPDLDSFMEGFALIGPDGQAVSGNLEIKEPKKPNDVSYRYEARWLPTARLEYNTRYTIKVDRTKIRSKRGMPLVTGWQSSFTTLDLPELKGVSPSDGALVHPATTLSFSFTNPMKLDDFGTHIQIVPKTPFVVLDSDIGPDATSVRVQYVALPGTTYTLTLDIKGLVDVWNTPLRVKPNDAVYRIVAPDKVQFRYVTSNLGPAMSLETNGQDLGVYNGHYQTRVFVTHRNVSAIGVTLNQMSLLRFLNQSYGNPKSKDEYENLVRRWVVPVYNPPNIMRYDLLSITLDGTSIGQQGNIVCIEGAPSNLAVGQKIRVVRKEVPSDDSTPTAPAPLNLRNEPGTQKTAVVGQAAYGALFSVLDGPVCADRYVWWKVQSEDGQLEGWIAEGDLKQPYVIPISESGTPQPTTTPDGQPKGLALTRTGDLPPGIYRVNLEAPDMQGGGSLSHTMLVATENITLKVARREALAWVTDLKSGQPAPGMTVQFYRLMQYWQRNRAYQKMVAYGAPVVTDKDGLARFIPPEEIYPVEETIFAAVVDAGHFALASSNWARGIDPSDFQQPTMFSTRDTALYIYSDRRLYKPGEKVYFRGTIRNRIDATYVLSEQKLIPVEIYDSFNQLIYDKKLPINEFGSFSDSFTIDKDAKLGEYRIVARPFRQDPPPPTPSPTPLGTPFIIQATPGTPMPTPTRVPSPSPVPVAKLQREQQQEPRDPQFVTQITVGDYSPPEYRVTVRPEVAHVAQGGKVRMLVESSYYFGGPVSNAQVQWTVRTDPYYFFYTGNGRYSFEDYNQDYIAQDYEDDQPLKISSGKGRTDEEGRFLIELPAALGKSGRSLVYTIEAVVWDKSDQMVAERGTVVIDQGEFQVGVGVENYVGTAGEKQPVHLIAVDSNSAGLPDVTLDVQVVRRVWATVQTIEPGTGRTIWENDLVEKEVAKGSVRTNAQGKADFEFTPQQGGAYKVYASTRDKRGNLIKSSTFAWIAGPGYVAWRAPNSNRIDLQADKTAYKVGDTASILIPTSFQGEMTALVTVERGGILKTEVLHLTSNSTIYKLPITPDMAPDAFVSVTVIKGVDATNFAPAFRMGLIQLVVDVERLRLNIEVTSDRKKAGPREDVTYKLHVTDYKGDPVRAEVGLALVDEANLALLPDNLPSLMAYFYSRQGLGVLTGNPLIFSIDQQTQEIINVQKGGGKGGEDYFGIFTVRRNFITTPLWQPSVITDENGDATVVATLPDQLTTWVLDARAYTLPTGDTNTTLVGQTTHSLISTRPLIIRPELPRFYVVGDTSTMSAIVNNNADEALPVAVTVEAKGVAVQGSLTKYATIPANGRLKFDWPMLVLDGEGVDLTFKVVSKDGVYTDAAKPVTGQGENMVIPVLRYETPDVVQTGGVIGTEGGLRVEGILTPPTPTPDDELQLRIDRSLASGMTDAMKALDIFPHYCIEQTVSRFLPNAVMFRAQKALKVENQALFNKLSATLETALQRIYADQKSNGGWGWFAGNPTDQLISAYVVLGLSEVRAAGWHVDEEVFLKAVNALRRSLRDVNEKTNWWDLNRQAFILYVLARASQPDVWPDSPAEFFSVSHMVKLFNQRDRMNLDAQAFLAMAFAYVEPASGYHTKPLMDNIKKKASYSLTGRYWEDVNADAWNWTTNTRTTAIVLRALTLTEPESDLLSDTVRWLMTARKYDSWETTQETAWAVMAFSAWMEKSGDYRPDYSFTVKVNEKQVGEAETATPDNVRQVYDLRLAVTDLLASQTNRLSIQRTAGDGTLYYSAQMKTYLPVEQVRAVSRGLMIERTYSLATDKDRKPIDSAQVGDTILVTLTIIVPESLNYVVIEDPIPAGTQSINTSLQTSAKLDKNRPLYYGWRYWVFSHKELRNDRTVLYAPYLAKGTYQFLYQIRAGAPGTYHVMPANGHAFYMPEVFGRSAGRMFTIKPEPDETF